MFDPRTTLRCAFVLIAQRPTISNTWRVQCPLNVLRPTLLAFSETGDAALVILNYADETLDHADQSPERRFVLLVSRFVSLGAFALRMHKQLDRLRQRLMAFGKPFQTFVNGHFYLQCNRLGQRLAANQKPRLSPGLRFNWAASYSPTHLARAVPSSI